MTRMRPNAAPAVWLAMVWMMVGAAPAWAAASQETSEGLRVALRQAADSAVNTLGKADGFFGNPDVKIPLPGKLQKARKTLRKLGLSKQIDALELGMNRAAEAAVPEAKVLLADAISQMSVTDALAIVRGPEDAATRFFRETMSERLTERFLPIVGKATADLSLAKTYDDVAARARALGVIEPRDATLDAYVTRKALDGLFLMMAREEAAIRRDPARQASALLRRVFGTR